MLLPHTTALRTLTLFLPLALSTPPAPIPQDAKLTGYVGPLPTPPPGDYLTTTYCYCSSPHHLPAPAWDEGSYFQWEYYNRHANATFIMHRLCRANHAEKRTCVDSKHVHCELDRDGDCEGNMLCSSWPRGAAVGGELEGEGEGEAGKRDHWCMTLDDHNVLGSGDGIVWNGQQRSLTMKGGQGREEVTGAEAEKVCEGLCGERVGMPMLRGDGDARSHQVVFGDLDDMCDECRR